MKKYNYKDDFEMLYLRHEYLTRCDKLEGKFVEEYASIVHTTARIMYNKLYPNFNKVGFQRDDIVAITNMYMLGYMGLYSLRFNKEKRDKFTKTYKRRFGQKPTEQKIYAADRNDMINFLRQRIQHCSVVCARKARSIIVDEDRRAMFAETANSQPAAPEQLLESHKKLGYRKITKKEYKECKKKARELREQTVTDKDGFKIINVEILSRGMSHEDYLILFEKGQSLFSMNPEDVFISLENKEELEGFKAKFAATDIVRKKRILKRFINKNNGDKSYKKELTLARKMLKKLRSIPEGQNCVPALISGTMNIMFDYKNAKKPELMV